MEKKGAMLLTVLFVFAIKVNSKPASPLELVRTIAMPGIAGRFDFVGIDLKGHRLFVTPLDHKTVEVYDFNSGKLIHSIPGISKAYAVLCRHDLDQIFVTDGPDGSIKLLSGINYKLVKAVRPPQEPYGIGLMTCPTRHRPTAKDRPGHRIS
jgi:WD40 repeat protein